MKRSFTYQVACLVLAFATTLIFPSITIKAAAVDTVSAKISITFDDGRTSNLAKAAPILAKYGLSATAYVVTDCVGMTKVHNRCRASTDDTYMTWGNLRTLRDTYGWEIGSHSKTHPYMASKSTSDGQPRLLTSAQVTTEVAGSKAALAAQGFNATSFASPYGDYSSATLREIAKYYTSQRGFADQNDNIYPYNDLVLNNFQVQTPVLPIAVQAKIDEAITKKTWLILTLHDIVDVPSDPSTYAYDWSTTYFEQIASYIKQKSDAGLITPVNMTAGLATGQTLLAGGDFTRGIANGWRTDAPTAFTATSGNGSFPSATNSVKLSASSRQAHLLSPKVSVNNATSYIFKSYLAMTTISGGEVGYYIDEYDANGNWVSGQWKGAERSVYTEKFNFVYTPTSSAVASAQLQIYSTPSTVLNGYVDNVEMFAIGATTTPAPVTTNLLGNASFDAGLTNWRTDNSSLMRVDTANHGSPANPVNSLKILGDNQKGHLYSMPVAVTAGTTYTLSQYVNITANTGSGLGWYIDEYNANGDWVSGQYRRWTNATGPQTVAFSYAPSSTAVAKASYQLIVETGAHIEAYFDNPIWVKQ